MDGILRFFNAGKRSSTVLPVTFPLRFAAGYCWGSSLISSTSGQRLELLISTLNDSGSPGSRESSLDDGLVHSRASRDVVGP